MRSGKLEKRKIGEADIVLSEMKKMSLEPNNLTYDILVAGYAKKSNKVDALRMYCDMVSKGFIPKASTYNSLINDFAKAGTMNQANELFNEMKKGEEFYIHPQLMRSF